MGTALILGASSESIHAVEVAKEEGYHVVALDGDPEAPGLRHADEAAVVDISDPANVISYFGDRRPSCIVPVPIGRALVSTGQLNEYWGTPGIGAFAATLCTDKYLFARFLRDKGLRCSQCYLESEVRSNPSLIESMELPLIVKPRFGSGSRGVSLLNAVDDAMTCLGDGDIVEEAFVGDEYGMDAIVVDGELSVLALRKKVNTPPPVCQCVGYRTLVNTDDAYTVVASLVEQIVDEIALRDGLLHADVMVRGDEAFVIELSGRPSGHSIHSHLVPLATGIDPIRLFLRLCVARTGSMPLVHVNPLYMGFFDLGEGTVSHVPSRSEVEAVSGALDYDCRINTGDYLQRTVDGEVTKLGRFILPDDCGDAVDRARSLLNLFEVS